jgi:hypothetical protein
VRCSSGSGSAAGLLPCGEAAGGEAVGGMAAGDGVVGGEALGGEAAGGASTCSSSCCTKASRARQPARALLASSRAAAASSVSDAMRRCSMPAHAGGASLGGAGFGLGGGVHSPSDPTASASTASSTGARFA